MDKRQMIGDNFVKLKESPRNVLPDNHKMGTVQMIGDKVKLSHEPKPANYGSNTPNGKLQMIGDAMKLSDKPHSMQNNMSQRAKESKKGY